jgi:hypothetical protein
MPTLGEQLDPRQPLKRLADTLPWLEFEAAFGKYYSEEGRPVKPVRLRVGLLLLKQMFNQGDETVVAAWVQNPYWQYFCGMSEFQWQVPCDPSDLVYFRKRIGEVGMQRILKVSAELHGDKAQEAEVVDGGPGYYRTPSLISCWSSAPFLHNNALGKFTGDRNWIFRRLVAGGVGIGLQRHEPSPTPGGFQETRRRLVRATKPGTVHWLVSRAALSGGGVPDHLVGVGAKRRRRRH